MIAAVTTTADQEKAADAPASSYVPVLDGFRAIAISLVLAAHFTHLYFIPGGFGVTLFFFISGLLITRLLLAEIRLSGRADLPRFYARRVMRLAPALVTLAIVLSGVALIQGRRFPASDVLAVVFYFANYYRVFVGFTLGFGLLWSLAVEEHYYIVFPYVLNRLMKAGRPLLVLSGLMAVALIWRTILMVFIHPPLNYTYMATDTRFDSILYGAILSVILYKYPHAISSRLLTGILAFTVGLLALLATFLMKADLERETIRYSIQGLALLPIVSSVVFGDRHIIFRWARAVLSTRPMTLIGKLSYSLYLWHYPCIFAVRDALPHLSPNVALALALVVSIAVSAASYFGVERSFLNLRRRFGSHAR